MTSVVSLVSVQEGMVGWLEYSIVREWIASCLHSMGNEVLQTVGTSTLVHLDRSSGKEGTAESAAMQPCL